MYYYFYETPVGVLRIVQKGNAVSSILRTSEMPGVGYEEAETALLHDAYVQLQEYFAGVRKEFSLPISPEGTDFQKKAWKALMEIPYGETISYKEEAERMGCSCARAVGQANGRNPIVIVIPCHRVIRGDGSIGGYSGGLDMKEYLLELEQKN